jgi:hypothetical protein
MPKWQMRPARRPRKLPRGDREVRRAADSQGTPSVRVLVAFEDIRRLYRDVFVRAIRDLRPALSVRSASLDELDHELGRFDPHVVISSQPSGIHPAGSGAWVQIPTDDAKEDDDNIAQDCLDGERWRTDGPPLAELLEVIDEAYERLREGSLSEAC